MRHTVNLNVYKTVLLFLVKFLLVTCSNKSCKGYAVMMFSTECIFYPQIISPTALFLAAKVEEQPRKLEHVIKVAHACLHPLEPQLDTKCDVCLYRDLI